ncbi:helix-turn-helix domain-containing protein [Bradyrhizobium sp. 153]|nr:helix-turn-helix domain-containing protein [Bradyrhizobium sp. 153]
MGRRSEKLTSQEGLSAVTQSKEVIQVVSRAFDVVRCFDGPSRCLGNREIADRCGLPRSTVSRLTLSLTRIGQLTYLPQDQKYTIGPNALALAASLFAGNCERAASAGMQERSTGVQVDQLDQFAL